MTHKNILQNSLSLLPVALNQTILRVFVICDLSSTLKFRRKDVTKVIIRFKTVSAENAGLYQCVAKNMLGEDKAKTKLTGM